MEKQNKENVYKLAKEREFKQVSAFLIIASMFTLVAESVCSKLNGYSTLSILCSAIGIALGGLMSFIIVYLTYKPRA